MAVEVHAALVRGHLLFGFVPGNQAGAFSVPHPQRGGRAPSADDRSRRDHVTLPDHTCLPVARWDFDAARWEKHLDRAGLWLASAQEFHDPRLGRRPTTLLITARKL